MTPLLLPRLLIQSLWSLTLTMPLVAADWPQWRGPQRDGHSPETALLQEWPAAGPELLWQVKDVGSGYSSPAVVGDTIYLLGNEGMDNEFAQARSTRDGGRLWSVKLGKVGRPQQNPNYPGSRSTPAVDGQFLYALGSDGDLVALETAGGKERWRRNLRGDFGGKCGEWAYAESPLVDGEALICTPGGSEATLVALNKRTGDVIWKCPLPEADDAGYASAVPAEFSGVKQYVQFLSKGLVGIEAKTGKLLWRYERTAKGGPAIVMTPLISEGAIYTGAFRVGGGLITPAQKDGTFQIEEVYFNNKLPFGLGGVVKVGDYFYGSGDPSAMCVEFKTGTIRWQERSGGLAWLVADGRLYARVDNGDVTLLEPTPDAYRAKGRFTPPNRPTGVQTSNALSYPVIADGRLYLRELNCLWCYNVKRAR